MARLVYFCLAAYHGYLEIAGLALVFGSGSGAGIGQTGIGRASGKLAAGSGGRLAIGFLVPGQLPVNWPVTSNRFAGLPVCRSRYSFSFAHESRSVTVRLKTGWPGFESRQSATK